MKLNSVNNDYSFRVSGELQLLVCEPLEHLGFKNAFSTRLGGVSSLPSHSLSLGNFRQDSRENIMENRRRFLTALGASDWTLVTASQVHSADVRSVQDELDARREPSSCDALTSNISRTLLAVQTADCMPILLVDERSRAFAAVHAGWRGTLARIVSRTLERMQLTYDTRPENVCAAFGPAIAACCFEVGPEVIAQFEQRFSFSRQAVSRRQSNGKAHLELGFINRKLLLDVGVPAEQIYDCTLCTSCENDLFFSYRRERGAEQVVGRLMGVVGREV
jgi:YfiH family protein